MALSANTVWEVRTGGADTNGGGFVAGASGTDWSQQNAAQYSVTDGVTNGTTTITSATAAFGTDVVGNLIYVQGGTGGVAAGWYQIISRTNATTIVVDRSTGLTAGTGVTLNIGGALATPGLAASLAAVNGHRVWVKAGTYTLTTSSAGAGGPVTLPAATVHIEGYSSTRGDRAGRPEINAGSVTSVNLISGTNGREHTIVHLQANGNSGSGVHGFDMGARNVAEDCVAINCDQASCFGFRTSSGTGGRAVGCKASACTTGFGSHLTVRCWADSCATGFAPLGNSCIECVASDCSGDGFAVATTPGSLLVGCTSDGNTGDGFDLAAIQTVLFGCAATNNGGYGYNTAASSTALVRLDYCASYNNTSGRTNTTLNFDTNTILLTGDPWSAAASDDYRPNSTASAGAALRSITGVGVFGQTDNRDIGAVQHADPAGGGAAERRNMRGGFIN